MRSRAGGCARLLGRTWDGRGALAVAQAGLFVSLWAGRKVVLLGIASIREIIS